MATTATTQSPRDTTSLETRIVARTLRVPALAGQSGDSTTIARQLDAALLSVGFTLSRELRDHLSGLAAGVAMDCAVFVLGTVRGLVGDHVVHNVYFRDFPAHVPDTVEFWMRCLGEALRDSPDPELIEAQAALGKVNLLDLPTYGTYQHTYAEMLAAHDRLMPSVTDRVTVLHLGASLGEEIHALYLSLAGSSVPLPGTDLAVLGEVAQWCVDSPQPVTIPVRENRAVLNLARLGRGRLPLVDTVTDVLRVACAASGGDVTLREPTRFRSLPRSQRRLLLAALDTLVGGNPAKLGDVAQHRERWKRLGERLHPHEYPDLTGALEAFAVARGDRASRSLASRVEHAFDSADLPAALRLLSAAPGMLLRNTDRLLRWAAPDDVGAVAGAVSGAVGSASSRVVLSLREHLTNRRAQAPARVFGNRRGRAWVTGDARPPLGHGVVARVVADLDGQLRTRLPAVDHLVVDPAVLGVALPLSSKSRPGGFGVMPRGSITPVGGDTLRFFTYWQQTEQRTDFDLSALLLDEDFQPVGWLSWTELRGYGGAHSGDITEAPGGASEFIDLDLQRVTARYIVPQVHVYSGEGFDQVAESMFGFMTRGPGQAGAPFEPRTVRMRSEMRGRGRVTLPVVFIRDDFTGEWSAKWLHLHPAGRPQLNQVEQNWRSTSLLVRGIVERRYLTVGWYAAQMMPRAVTYYELGMWLPDRPVTFIGIEQPEGLPEGSQVYTLDRLHELIVP